MLILLLLSVVYFVVLFWASRLFPKPIGEQNLRSKPASVQISVIIPFRNEEKNLLPLLGDLIRQNYPPALFEIIFADDHSDDNGPALLKRKLAEPGHHRISLLKAEGTGKKAALSAGIARAAGELIVTHDADCRLPADMLQNFANNYAQTGASLIAAPVVYQNPRKLSEHFFQIEFASAVGLSALLFAAGRPLMCNGAGLAFTKKAFDEVGGYAGNAHIPSGDDHFLLQKINRTFPRPDKLPFFGRPGSKNGLARKYFRILFSAHSLGRQMEFRFPFTDFLARPPGFCLPFCISPGHGLYLFFAAKHTFSFFGITNR